LKKNNLFLKPAAISSTTIAPCQKCTWLCRFRQLFHNSPFVAWHFDCQ